MPSYAYSTPRGVFTIVQRDDGRWHPMYDGESLGSYQSPQAAASDLAGGHTFSVGPGIDTAKLGIPEDLNEWEHRTA